MVFSTDYNQEEIRQEAIGATIPLALDWQEGWRRRSEAFITTLTPKPQLYSPSLIGTKDWWQWGKASTVRGVTPFFFSPLESWPLLDCLVAVATFYGPSARQLLISFDIHITIKARCVTCLSSPRRESLHKEVWNYICGFPATTTLCIPVDFALAFPQRKEFFAYKPLRAQLASSTFNWAKKRRRCCRRTSRLLLRLFFNLWAGEDITPFSIVNSIVGGSQIAFSASALQRSSQKHHHHVAPFSLPFASAELTNEIDAEALVCSPPIACRESGLGVLRVHLSCLAQHLQLHYACIRNVYVSNAVNRAEL